MSQTLSQERAAYDKRPSIHDLYTISSYGGDMWYQLGLELGLSSETLEAIIANHRLAKKQCFMNG